MGKEYKRVFKILDYSKVDISKNFIVLEQFYLNFTPKIKCRRMSNKYTLDLKIPITNNEKIEHGREIDKEEYEILKEQRVSKIITKRRHSIFFDGNLGFYDEYYGEFDLKLVSLEFETIEEMNSFKVPKYLKEIGDCVLSINDLIV